MEADYKMFFSLTWDVCDDHMLKPGLEHFDVSSPFGTDDVFHQLCVCLSLDSRWISPSVGMIGILMKWADRTDSTEELTVLYGDVVGTHGHFSLRDYKCFKLCVYILLWLRASGDRGSCHRFS